MAVAFAIFVTLLIIIEPLTLRFGNLLDSYNKMNYFVGVGILKTFPTSLFCFTCTSNTQDIFAVILFNLKIILLLILIKELQRPTRRRMSRIIMTTMGIALISFCLAGTFGYLTFSLNIQSLKNSNGIILLADYHEYLEITIVNLNY